MDNIAWYLLASGISLGLLLIPYRLHLSRLTHFKWNRFYLLGVLGLSLFLSWPGMQPDLSFLQSEQGKDLTAAEAPVLPPLSESQARIKGTEQQIFIPSISPLVLEENVGRPAEAASFIQLAVVWKYVKWGLWGIYLIGLVVGLFGLMKGILRVLSLFHNSPRENGPGYRIAFLQQSSSSFSFFRLLFLSPEDRNSADRSSIEAHEAAHIRQWHSIDVLLAELVCCFWWFLPWSRYLKKSLKETHEFLADEAASIGKGKTAYSRLLLSQTIIASRRLPVHHFAQSKTQKRIVMLNKSRSRKSALWTYMGIIPVLLLSVTLLAAVPGPPDPEPTTETDDKTLTFAGETFPQDQVYLSGLETRINRLKAKPDLCRKLCLRGARYQPEITKMLMAFGVHKDFFYLAMAESYLDPEASSSMGACGIWQFMPATARSYGMEIADENDDRKNLSISTKAAAQYLNKYQKEFGNWTSAALAYNRGPKPVREVHAGNNQELEGLYKLDHDRGYLYNILAIKQLFENPASFGIEAGPGFGLPFARSASWGKTSGFGPRRSPFDQKIKNHNGIDLKAKPGTEVLAVSDGTVKVASLSDESPNGHQIKLIHASPMSSVYNHLDEVRVKPGQKVKKGDVIGTVGTTGLSKGPHLHLEIRENEVPVDPELYIRF